MIILEGLDKTGKSTVAKAICKYLPGWSYQHHTKPPEDPYIYFGRFLAHANPEIVVDRLHLSERAYGNVYRPNEPGLSDHQWQMLELACMSRSAIIFYFHDTVNNIVSRWNDKEMYAPNELTLMKLQDEYTKCIKQTQIPVLQCTYNQFIDEDGKHKELSEVGISVVKSITTKPMMYTASIGFGNPRPRFIVVAEEINYNQIVDSKLPQFPLSEGPASEVFWAAMNNIGDNTWKFGYYINANDIQNAETFLCNTNYSGCKVITLGATARDKINELNTLTGSRYEIHNLKHPAWSARFGGGKERAINDLTLELKRCLSV